MKRLLLVILGLIIISSFANSQDLIIKTNGDTIKCIVTDVGVDIIKCKDFRSPDGPDYRILKKDVIKIEYDNGETSSFEDRRPDGYLYRDKPLRYKKGKIWLGMRKLDGPSLRYLYSPYPDVYSIYRNGKTLSVMGGIIGIPSAIFFGYSLGYMVGGGEANDTVLAISSIGLIGGLTMMWMGNNNIKASVRIYNNAIKETAVLNIKFGITDYGLGLCLSF